MSLRHPRYLLLGIKLRDDFIVSESSHPVHTLVLTFVPGKNTFKYWNDIHTKIGKQSVTSHNDFSKEYKITGY